jgi:hypothetical protein
MENTENTENTVISSTGENGSGSEVKDNKSEAPAPSPGFMTQLTPYNIMSGNILNSGGCNRITDMILIMFTVGGLSFGAVAWFVIDNITAIGYIFTGLFSGISLCSIRRMRLRASLQSSVNVLKEENDELKEHNDDLKGNIGELEGNIDELEVVSKSLTDDLAMLKETIGIFGENSDKIIENLREVYNNLKSENEIQSSINQNSVYLHILHIIKHYDKRSEFVLTATDLEKAKKTLINVFPNLDYESLKKKLKNNKITAEKIFESVTPLKI